MTKSPATDKQEEALWAMKRKTKRSWLQLRRGCQDLLGKNPNHSTYMVGASSRAFARKASAETGLSCELILKWLDASGLGAE